MKNSKPDGELVEERKAIREIRKKENLELEKLEMLRQKIEELESRILLNEPSHFSKRDLVDAFFGALFLGLPFSIKGLLITVSTSLTKWNVIFIILSTILILTAEIYFIGYSRVTKKSERKFGQFWLKRFVAFFTISIVTSLFLVFLFGLNNLADIGNNSWNICRLATILSMPCAIGAAITDLLKKY